MTGVDTDTGLPDPSSSSLTSFEAYNPSIQRVLFAKDSKHISVNLLSLSPFKHKYLMTSRNPNFLISLFLLTFFFQISLRSSGLSFWRVTSIWDFSLQCFHFSWNRSRLTKYEYILVHGCYIFQLATGFKFFLTQLAVLFI